MRSFLRKARSGGGNSNSNNNNSNIIATSTATATSTSQSDAARDIRTSSSSKQRKDSSSSRNTTNLNRLKIDADAVEKDYAASAASSGNNVKFPQTPPTARTASTLNESSYSTGDDDDESNDNDDNVDNVNNIHQASSSTPMSLPLLDISSTAVTTPIAAVRKDGDVRSPGARATPMAVFPRHHTDTTSTELEEEDVDDENNQLLHQNHNNAPQDGDVADSLPAPDFMTQTDKDGKSLSLAPAAPKPLILQHKSNSLAKLQPKKEETFIDSLRVMCCCLLLDESNDGSKRALQNGEHSNNGTTSSVLETKAEAGAALSSETYHYHLPPPATHKKCLVLDLDETLVHSSFRAVPSADFILPVQVDSVLHSVYVAKRPGVDEFLRDMARHFEIVVYTASLNKYADPLLDLLDPTNEWISHRLFREHCAYFEGHYVKDLNTLNRPLESTIIVDNSPNSYLFHPDNAIDCSSFIDDVTDRELDQIGDFLRGVKHVQDVRHVCRQWRGWPNIDIGGIDFSDDEAAKRQFALEQTSDEDEDDNETGGDDNEREHEGQAQAQATDMLRAIS
jgi:RNA polymerase II subunit A small phosphatase-like protein